MTTSADGGRDEARAIAERLVARLKAEGRVTESALVEELIEEYAESIRDIVLRIALYEIDRLGRLAELQRSLDEQGDDPEIFFARAIPNWGEFNRKAHEQAEREVRGVGRDVPVASSPSIAVVDQYVYNVSVLFGLEIKGPKDIFPAVVGCSLRTRAGEIVDLPARRLRSAGLAIWDVRPDARFGNRADSWEGDVLFALWGDDRFRHRLVDTGWVPWVTHDLVGSSVAGLDLQDERVESKYGSRRDVWERLG